MRHFSSTEWVDFVRNVVVAEQRVPMQEHLDRGCADCHKIVRIWATMAEFARREIFFEPPDSAVRIAESYFFPLQLALKEKSNVRLLRHVFDSFNFGALAGIRSAGAAPRQLMYDLDGVVIDLRVEPTSNSKRMMLAGQVMDARLTEGNLEEIPVVFFGKDSMTLQTTTNRFGEFSFSFDAVECPGLLLNMKGAALLLLFPEDLAGNSLG